MSLYRVELKRQLKTRSVQLLLLLALLVTFVFSYCPISFVEYAYEENGQEIHVKGMSAISLRREAWKPYGGVLTEEKLASALEQYQILVNQYGEDGVFTGDLSDSEYSQKVAPISSWIYRMREVYANPKTGSARNVQEMTQQDALNFYQQCHQRLDDVLRMEQSNHPTAAKQAKALYSHVEMPFSYYPGFNTDAVDYLVLLILVLTILGVLIAVPVFSSEYQTGSDQILRCTKYGKSPLALAKIKAALTITSGMYLICVSLYLLIEGLAFGWDTLKTSIQVCYSATSFPAMNVGQLMLFSAGAGLLAYLATILCTLFLSSKRSSIYGAASLALLLCILPILTVSTLPETADLWVRFLLPTGGIGLSNSFLFELLDTRFLHLGSVSLWYPFTLLLSSVLEAPIWLSATVRTYRNRTL